MDKLDALVEIMDEKERLKRENKQLKDTQVVLQKKNPKIVLTDYFKLEEENTQLKDALHQIKTWVEAYPLKIFPEPDMKKAHELLKAGGINLDAVSASNMRHVLKGVKEIVDKALESDK